MVSYALSEADKGKAVVDRKWRAIVCENGLWCYGHEVEMKFVSFWWCWSYEQGGVRKMMKW